MRLHSLQHVWFEDMGVIEKWAEERGSTVTKTALYDNETLPQIDDFDFLVVMGGSMGVYDEIQYPWLRDEKIFIKETIARGKTVLGICLGAQIIADVLGAKVYKNKHKEIGWFKLKKCNDSFNFIPSEFMAFHWHGDTFDLPVGAKHLALSQACINQAFSVEDGRVIGLQFHLEITQNGVERLTEQCANEIIEDKFIQNRESMINQKEHLIECNKLMMQLLDGIQLGVTERS